jgi:hypothetical protein
MNCAVDFSPGRGSISCRRRISARPKLSDDGKTLMSGPMGYGSEFKPFFAFRY